MSDDSDDVVRRYNGARPMQAPAKLLDDAIREVEILREENARLREALKPFSKNYWSDDWHDGSDCEINVQLRDIRRAASLVDGYVWTPDE